MAAGALRSFSIRSAARTVFRNAHSRTSTPKGNFVADSGTDLWPPNPNVDRKKVGTRKVIKDEVLASGLSRHHNKLIPIKGVRKLTLDDGSVVYGCAECVYAAVEDTEGMTMLGAVRQHRAIIHGASTGGAKRGRSSAGDAPASIPRDMTVYELFELAAHIDEWEVVLSSLEKRLEEKIDENTELRQKLRVAERENASIKKKVARSLGLELVHVEG